MPVLGVKVNTTIQSLRRFSVLGLLRRRRERRAVTDLVEQLEIRTPSIEQPVEFLSGGNQQKVSVARTFFKEPSVILAYEPTQGVDVGSRFDIYKALRTRTDKGTAMLVKSSDPIELSGLCDRVLVMSRGRSSRRSPATSSTSCASSRRWCGDPVCPGRGDRPWASRCRGAPRRTGRREQPRRRSAPRGPQGPPRRTRQEQVAEDRQVPPVDARGAAGPAGCWTALLHHLTVPGLRQRLQRPTDPDPGAPPDRGRDGPDPRDPGRVSRSVGRRHDRPRGGHRLVPDRRRGVPPPDPVRDRRHPGLRRRPRPRQRGPDPGTQDPLDHRHPGHAEHPGRDLTDDATDGAGRHRSRTDLRAHGEHRADPRGVHRHRRGGGSRRSLAPCFRIGSGAEGRRLRRPVGQTGRGQDQPAPGPGPRPVGRAGGRGRVLRHGPVPDRERDHRIHLRPEQHHRRRPGRRRPRRRPGHVPGEHGGGAPARAHHHRPPLPRSVTRRRAADHRRLGAARDRPVPARRPEGARQEQLQACPAPGHEEPATQGRRAPGLLPERPGLPRGSFGQDADPRRDGAQHGSHARGPPVGRRADRGGEDRSRSGRTCRTARSR